MWLTCHVAEYMMFKDDEEDTEAPAEISSSDSVNDFSVPEESKKKQNSKWHSKWQMKCPFGETKTKVLLGLP